MELAPSLPLGRLARLVDEAQPQRVVVSGEPFQGCRERRHRERLPDGEEHRLVEALRLPPLGGEKAALDRGERHLAGHRSLLGRLAALRLPIPDRRDRHTGRELGDRLVLKQQLGGEEEARLARPRHHLDGEDRVAAELEEVVVHPHPLAAEHPAPDLGQPLLPDVPRRGRRLLLRRARSPRLGERLAVHLTARLERQLGQEHEDGGHQRLRQERPQEGPQLLRRRLRCRECRRCCRDHIGYQLPVATAAGARQDDRLPHRGMAGEGRLDFPRLDTDAAHLDLKVDAAEELQASPQGRHLPDEVARAVEPAVVALDEPLGGELRAAEVAAGDPRAADPQLARNPQRHRLSPRIDHPRLDPGERPAEERPPGRTPAIPARHPLRGADDRRLRRSIDDVELGVGEGGEKLRLELGRDGLPPGGDRPQAGGELPPAFARPSGGDLAEDGRHPDDAGRPGERRRERRGIEDLVAGQNLRRAAGQEGSDDLQERGVEGVARQVRRAVARPQPVAVEERAEHRGEVAVLDHHRLGPAGRPRGIEEIGELPGVRAGKRAGRLFPLQVEGTRSREVERPHAVRELQGERSAMQHGRRSGVQEEVGQPPGRSREIERYVGAARLPDAEDRHREVDRAIEEQSHPRSRPHPGRLEPVGQLGGAAVELGIREGGEGRSPGGRREHRERLRRALGLRRETFRRRPAGERRRRIAPLAESLVARRRREDRQGLKADRGIGHRRRDLQQEALDLAFDGGGVEEVGVVLQRAHEPGLGIVEQAEHQVVAGAAVVGVDRRELDPGEPHLGGLAIEHLDERLDQRLPAGIARQLDRLHQLAERQILVGVGAERRLANPDQELAEGGIAGQVESEGDLSQEAADDRLDLGPVAIGVVGAQDQLLLAGVAMEEHRGGGEHGHEKGGSRLPAQRAQPRSQPHRHGDLPPAAEEPRRGWARPVGGQLERQGEVGELLAPPGGQLGEHLPGEPAALPHREVRVLHRQCRQGLGTAGSARREGGIDRRHLAPGDLEGEEIGHQVVDGEEAEVIRRAHPHQARSHQRPARQVERRRHVRSHQARRLLLAPPGGERRYIEHRHALYPLGRHPLHRATVENGERGAPGGVAADDAVEGRGEERYDERTAHPRRRRDIEPRPLRVELLQEPVALLVERQRPVALPSRAAHPRDGRGGGGARRFLLLLDQLFEQRPLLGRERRDPVG